METEVRDRHSSSKDDLGTATPTTIRSKKWRLLPLPLIQQTEESACVRGACFETERERERERRWTATMPFRQPTERCTNRMSNPRTCATILITRSANVNE